MVPMWSGWLLGKFSLDLSLAARLGGQSAPRTHRGKKRFLGMTITYALIQVVEKIAEKTDRVALSDNSTWTVSR